MKVLGEPDESSVWDPDEFIRALDRLVKRHPDIYVDEPNWTRFVRYWNRWSTLCLDVYEYRDGRLEHAITGLHPDDHRPSKPRHCWQRLRLSRPRHRV